MSADASPGRASASCSRRDEERRQEGDTGDLTKQRERAHRRRQRHRVGVSWEAAEGGGAGGDRATRGDVSKAEWVGEEWNDQQKQKVL